MSLAIVSIKDGLNTGYLYFNDYVADLIAEKEPGTYRIGISPNKTVTEIASLISNFLHDNQYWFVMPMPINSFDTIGPQLFPNAKINEQKRFNFLSYTFENIIDNVTARFEADSFYKTSGSVWYEKNTYFTKANVNYNELAVTVDDRNTNSWVFMVFNSADIDLKNRRFKPNDITTNRQKRIKIRYNFDTGILDYILYAGITAKVLYNNTPNIYDVPIYSYIGTLDPYSAGGTTGDDSTYPEGGEGDYSSESDPVPVPSVPNVQVTDTGFISLYNPTLAQIKSLASYMWSSSFDLDTFKKLFSKPMESILSLTIVPVTPTTSGNVNVILGNVNSGVAMPLVSNQYVTIDCGTINISEYWGAYLDYSPYTKIEIYLPYIGVKPLNPDDIMETALNVIYHVDVMSGACVAFLVSGERVLYSFQGQAGGQVPISSTDMSGVITSVISIAGIVGATALTKGVTAPEMVKAGASSAVLAATAKESVAKSGGIGGFGGLMSSQKPYLIITRPRQAVPGDQNSFIGYPSYITRTLSTVSGYTEIESIHLEGIPCTYEEGEEIAQLLREGAIF